MLAVLPSLLQRAPVTMHDIADPGTEALTQIFGSQDAEADSDASVAPPERDAALDVAVGGQVVLPSGEPAAGARVTAVAPNTDVVHEVVTDSGGMFAFEQLAPGPYVVEGELAGYGPAIALGVEVGQTQLRLTLQSGQEIQGLVTRGDEPVPFAVVHLGGPGTFPQRAVVADSRGQFTLAGLRSGRYEIITTADGFGSGFGGRISVDEPTGDAARLDVPVFRAAMNRVQIVDATTQIPVVTAVITLSEGPMHVLSLSETARGGYSEIDFLPRGDYHVRVRSPGYLPYSGVLRISGSESDITIEMQSGATVRGTVRDAVGNPVSRVSLTAVVTTPENARWELRETLFDDFHRLVRPDGTPFWIPSSVYRTESDGRFSLSGLPPGQARIIASHRDYAVAVSSELQLEVNTVYEPVNLVMQPGRRLRGRVEDGAGGAVAGAFVSVRPPNVPGWASPVGAVTSAVGIFDLADLPEDVIVHVRHPEFASTEMRISIPADGLDDFIIRLSGDQLPALSGRLFTSRGRPAVGALIWLMAGETTLPACQATVGADGWFRATHCSSVPETLIASYADHAPLTAEMAGDEPRDWEMPIGGELEVLSRGTPVVVTVEPRFSLPLAHWVRPQITLDSWSRELVTHVAAGGYRVTCSADGFDDGVIDVMVQDGGRTEAACPNSSRMVDFPIVVVDPQGAPVSGAVVFVDRTDPPLRAVTNERGIVMVRARPGLWLNGEAMHDQWGHGYLQFYSHYEEQTQPPRIVLEDPIGGDAPETMLDALETWGVRAQADGNGMIVDTVIDGTPAAGIGLRRLDRLLWVRPMNEFRLSVGARRDGELLTFELVREPGTP